MRFVQKLPKLALGLQIALVVTGLVVATACAMATVGLLSLNRQIDAEITDKTLRSLRVAVALTSDAMPQMRVERNAAGEPELLRVAGTSLADPLASMRQHDSIVDSITETNGGTATIFRWDPVKSDFVRVATTVKKPDGSRAIGTYLGQSGVVYPVVMARKAFRGIAHILGEPHQTGYLPIVGADDKPVGILYIGVGKVKELAAVRENFVQRLLLWSVLVLAGAALIALLAARWLLNPLRRLAKVTEELAAGSSAQNVPFMDRPDQIGVLARAVTAFQQASERQRALEQDKLAQALDLNRRRERVEASIQAFRSGIGAVLEEMRSGATAVQATSVSIRTVVEDVEHEVIAARKVAEAGSLAVAGVASATDEFSGSIAEIATQSNDAAVIVRRASDSGNRAARTVGELASVVARIEETVTAIRSIADQTNLLALNATIEAARAGEAGRGFAVVASEVKLLSTETAKATTEISELVANIQAVTRAVTEATGTIEQDLATIDKTTMVIAAAVSQQEAVTQEMARSAQKAAGGSHELADRFAAVDKAIQTTSRSAADLGRLSDQFGRAADKMVGEVEGFLKEVAA